VTINSIRYHAERLANNLHPVIPDPLVFNVANSMTLKHGYNPHLRDAISQADWAPRPNDAVLNVSYTLHSLFN